MKNQITLVASPAIFSLIGMWAAYLTKPDMTVAGAGVGLALGFGIGLFAVAGEK